MKRKSRKVADYMSDDPQAASEAAKYENPVPSREYILQCLEDSSKLLDREQLGAIFNLQDDPDLIEGLRRRLRAMERDGQIIFTRKGFAPVSKLDLIRGRVIGHADGFGFLQRDEGGDDLFLSARQMSRVMHNDRVVAHVVGYNRRGKPEAAIVEILEHANKKVIGRFYKDSGVCTLIPDNKRLSKEIQVPCDMAMSATDGQFVVVEITQYPDKRGTAIGKVVEILGDHMAPGMEIDVAMRSFGIPEEWPQELLTEIAPLQPQVAEQDKKGRLDLRDMALVTIDGEDSRDFDDAVYCTPTKSGWRLFVAIADVSHYVAPKTALDAEAKDRGNSVYFPERVIPMLPEILSNGLCSLNPDVDRLCMVCEITIDRDGVIKRSKFHEAVMRSHARLTYTKVAAMLVDKDEALRNQYSAIVPHLENLYDLYHALRKERTERGAIDFDLPETRIVFSDDRKIERIEVVKRNDAHMLIEECMIAANVCSARFILKHRIPGLFRVHEKPAIEKIENLRKFLGEFGLQLGGGEQPEAWHYSELLEQVRGHVDFHLIQTVMLRSLRQAQYQPDNEGHFGLGLQAYSHFTSPIRRFPDLLVHRAIRHILRHKKAKDFGYSNEDMLQLGEHCSMTDRRAEEATRDVISWLKCEFMRDKVGDEFEGVISSVTSFGLFIELNDIFVEGLVHVSELDSDFYHYDASGHRLVGERTGRVFRLGDTVSIQVVRVDLDERKIDFSLRGHKSVEISKSVEHKKRKKKKAKTSSASESRRKPRQKNQTGQKRKVASNTAKKKVTQKKKTSKKVAVKKKKVSQKKSVTKKKVVKKMQPKKKVARNQSSKKKQVAVKQNAPKSKKKSTAKKKTVSRKKAR